MSLALACQGSGADEDTSSAGPGDSSGLGDEIGDTTDDEGMDEAESSGSTTGGKLDMPDDEAAIVGIAIDPPSAVIEVVDGVIPDAVDFTPILTNDEGVEFAAEGSVVWSFDRLDMASLDPGPGTLTATGLLGGVGILSATYEGLEAQAQVTVKLKYTFTPDEPLDPLAEALLDTATEPDPALDLLYPYDATVFPRGLLGPRVQWNGGNDTDVYKIHAESETFELDWYGAVPNPSRWDFPALPDDIWLKLTDSTTGAVSFELRRYDGVSAYLSGVQEWTIAPASLAGTIYYWAVNEGDVLRIQPGASEPEQFLEKPEGTTCLACHSVSRDGSTIVASQNGGPSPWATFNPDGSNVFASAQASGFQAISPDGAWILWGQSNGAFLGQPSYMILSAKDSDEIAAQMFQTTGYPVHPAWSNNGARLSYGVRTDGDWLDFNNSTLWVVDVDVQSNPPAFLNPVEIVLNDPARPTVSYPTWSPDDEWIAFGRATQARTRGAAGELWMVHPDGTGAVELDRANGFNHIPELQTAQNYEPTFVPVASGGYFWMVFVSERQYGNTLTDQVVATRSKQLWVTAIDVNAEPGSDPSHPAFWLPGQGLDNNNMRGFSALDECKGLGESCEAGYECCGGFCIEVEPGVFVCEDDEPACSPNGSACEVDEDCCSPEAECIGGFCTTLIG